MKNYVKLNANGFVNIVALDEEDKLRAWYKAIDCDLVDIIEGANLPEPYVLICDDEALLKEKPILNPVASLLYGTREHGQPLCGNVLIGKDTMTDEGIETNGYDMEEAMGILDIILKQIAPELA